MVSTGIRSLRSSLKSGSSGVRGETPEPTALRVIRLRTPGPVSVAPPKSLMLTSKDPSESGSSSEKTSRGTKPPPLASSRALSTAVTLTMAGS